MLPVDPLFLLYLKGFVVFTCVFFWIKLGYDAFRRSYHLGRHRH